MSGWVKEHALRHEQTDYRRKLTRELRGIPGLTDEDWRLLLRLLDPWQFEEWTESRGLRGLKLATGGVSQWDFGWRVVCHLKGRLDFHTVQEQGHHIVTALGLKNGNHTVPEVLDLEPREIAAGMAAVHRKTRGSVLMILPGDRSDRCVLWFGMSDRLAPVVKGQDAMQRLHEAAERERKEERMAAKSASRATPEELAHNLATQRQFTEEWKQQNPPREAAVRPSPASGGRGRTTVCDDVRRVLTDVPDGLSAAEIKSKTDRALSKIYDCLNAGLADGEYVQNHKIYTLAPKIEEEN